MDFEHYRPWILCIESEEPTAEYLGYKAWEDMVIENDYTFAGEKYANRYYVLAEKLDIIDRFREIDHLEDYYDIIFYSERQRYEKYIRILQSKALTPFWLRCCVKRFIG